MGWTQLIDGPVLVFNSSGIQCHHQSSSWVTQIHYNCTTIKQIFVPFNSTILSPFWLHWLPFPKQKEITILTTTWIHFEFVRQRAKNILYKSTWNLQSSNQLDIFFQTLQTTINFSSWITSNQTEADSWGPLKWERTTWTSSSHIKPVVKECEAAAE